MDEKHPTGPDILADLVHIAAGFAVLAAAAIGAVGVRKRGASVDTRTGPRTLNDILRQRPAPRRKPPKAGIAVPAIPPRGPLPKQGGAAAALTFET
jgi:hypothetical protein